jgi:hypothetical protein
MKSGIGGVISLLGGLGVRDELPVGKLLECASGLGLAVRLLLRMRAGLVVRLLFLIRLGLLGRVLLMLLFERMRLYGRAGHVIICPLIGDAVTTVPGVAAGAGVGESLLKRGWI